MTEKQRRSILFTALAGVAVWSLWLAFNEPADDVELVEVAKTSTRAKPAPAKPAATPVVRKPSVQLSPKSAAPGPSRPLPR